MSILQALSPLASPLLSHVSSELYKRKSVAIGVTAHIREWFGVAGNAKIISWLLDQITPDATSAGSPMNGSGFGQAR